MIRALPRALLVSMLCAGYAISNTAGGAPPFGNAEHVQFVTVATDTEDAVETAARMRELGARSRAR